MKKALASDMHAAKLTRTLLNDTFALAVETHNPKDFELVRSASGQLGRICETMAAHVRMPDGSVRPLYAPTVRDQLDDLRMENARMRGLHSALVGVLGLPLSGGEKIASEEAALVRFCDLHRAARQVGRVDEFEKIFPVKSIEELAESGHKSPPTK